MQQQEIVSRLAEIADLLEVAEANEFEVAAFRRAANALDEWTGDLAAKVDSEEVTSIPSIGKGIAQVVVDLFLDRESEDDVRVRALVPKGIPELLKVRGLGPKRVRALWKQLDIKNLQELRNAAESGQIQTLKGFGAKTVEKLLKSLDYLERPVEVKTRKADDIQLEPHRAASGLVTVGMSGYSYPDWKGTFYPEDAKTKDLLVHYAARFATVEINNTFYRFPTEKVLQQWIAQTPDEFQFALKAHSRITHKLRLSAATEQTIIDFVERCGLLGSKLGCILFQLPPDFRRDDAKLDFLLSTLPNGPRYAIEFRHDSWFEASVLQKLQSNNISLVAGDGPGSSALRETTADFVYARLRRDNYAKDELSDWQRWFAEQSKPKRDVMAYFKHDDAGHAGVTIASLWGSPPRKRAASATQRKRQSKTGS